MSDVKTTESAPPPAPLVWYKSPLFGQAVGLALGLALAWLYAKTGITPAPIPQPLQPSVLVLNLGSHPAGVAPIPVAGK